ncbi:MAG: hypothetical protein ACK5HR_02655 [Mycoplasmatales bacterium]
MKKIILTMLILLLLSTFPVNIIAEEVEEESTLTTEEQIEKLQDEVAQKVDTLNEYESDLEKLEKNIDALEKKEQALIREKTELQEKIKKSENYIRNYLEFLQEAQNTKLLLRILVDKDFLPALYQILKVSKYVSKEFEEIVTDINELEVKELEYTQTLETLEQDKKELEVKIKKSEEVYVNLNKQLVELEKVSDFKNLYDDNAKISQKEQEKVMKEANISEDDYDYVDYIVTHESSWNYTATNPYSGAYGLCQSLPPEKMKTAGNDWKSNPVTQLTWCNNYAKSRYGSWEKAQKFWRENNWW